MPYKDLSKRNMSALKRRKMLGKAAPPEGFAPFKISTGPEGQVVSVQSKPVGDEKPFDIQLKHQHVKGISTLLDSEGNVSQQWIKTDTVAQRRENQLLEAFELHVKKYSSLAPPVSSPITADSDLQTWYPIGDPHLGLLAHRFEVGDDSDLKLASQILFETIDMLVDRSPASESGVICSLGDYFHADSSLNRTQSGHALDVDSRHSKVAEVGFSLMRRMVERALSKHKRVLVVNAPGNHAPNTEKLMGLWLKAVFEREPRVEVLPSTNPYIYHRFGECLVGVHHGDGAKIADLPAIMACDRSKDWGETWFRTWYTGHIHHDSRKDFRGCSVESFRTMNTSDAWSHHAGYRSGRSLQAITLHKKWGEQGRVTVGIKELDNGPKAGLQS